MNLIIKWAPPTPVPDCGYITQYRRNGDPTYSLAVSGSTSGATNYTTVTVDTPANYEGSVQSNCCQGNLSEISPFGVNSYSPLNFGVIVTVDSNLPGFHYWYQLTIVSTYANPYATFVTGTFVASGRGVIPFSVSYPSGVTTYTTFVVYGAEPDPNAIISSRIITSLDPVFNGGGTLQQFDFVNTPPYFQFYDGASSGNTNWTGSPTALPSFTLTAFNSTIVDESGIVLAGQLLISWIQSSVYNQTSGGTIPAPYTQVTFIVKDAGNNILGTLTTFTGTLGLINAAITLTRSSNLYPLTPSTQLMMITQWANSSTIISKQFYLP